MHSFSSNSKEIILKEDIENFIYTKCCMKTILCCLLIYESYKIGDDSKIEVSIHNDLLSEFFTKLLNYLNIEFKNITSLNQKGKFCSNFYFSSKDLLDIIEDFNSNPKEKCCRENWLKYTFICIGHLSDPSKSYNLEFFSSSPLLIERLQQMLLEESIEAKYYKKSDSDYYSLYIKNIEQILHFLALIKANKTLLDIESLRVEKDLINKLTRQVNYETSNIQKTAESSVKYIKAIEWYYEQGLFDTLPESLQEVARLRLQYPNKNLRELCDVFPKPITKSGINHRLRRLYGIIQKEKLKTV